MVEQTTGLLEWLRLRMGEEYLSNLRAMMSTPPGRWRLRAALLEAQPEDWSLSAWRELVRYLTGDSTPFHSQSEARSALLQSIMG